MAKIACVNSARFRTLLRLDLFGVPTLTPHQTPDPARVNARWEAIRAGAITTMSECEPGGDHRHRDLLNVQGGKIRNPKEALFARILAAHESPTLYKVGTSPRDISNDIAARSEPFGVRFFWSQDSLNQGLRDIHLLRAAGRHEDARAVMRAFAAQFSAEQLGAENVLSFRISTAPTVVREYARWVAHALEGPLSAEEAALMRELVRNLPVGDLQEGMKLERLARKIDSGTYFAGRWQPGRVRFGQKDSPKDLAKLAFLLRHAPARPEAEMFVASESLKRASYRPHQIRNNAFAEALIASFHLAADEERTRAVLALVPGEMRRSGELFLETGELEFYRDAKRAALSALADPALTGAARLDVLRADLLLDNHARALAPSLDFSEVSGVGAVDRGAMRSLSEELAVIYGADAAAIEAGIF